MPTSTAPWTPPTQTEKRQVGTSVTLDWTYDVAEEPLIDSFQIEVTDNPSNPIAVNTAAVPKNLRTYTFSVSFPLSNKTSSYRILTVTGTGPDATLSDPSNVVKVQRIGKPPTGLTIQ